jgi:hypothetical protein
MSKVCSKVCVTKKRQLSFLYYSVSGEGYFERVDMLDTVSKSITSLSKLKPNAARGVEWLMLE